VAIRVARQWAETSPSLIDDLIQETYLRAGYIKVFTANLIHDHFKALRAHPSRRWHKENDIRLALERWEDYKQRRKQQKENKRNEHGSNA